MLIQIGGLHLNVSPIVLGGVAAGVAVVLIILIICSCWCCCRRKNKKEKKNAQKFHGENPPGVQGNQNGRAGQQWQQQNNPPRIPEHRMVPNHSPPTRFPAHVPVQSSSSSTGSSSLPPHSVRRPPRPYPESPHMGQNTKTNGSSIPPQSSGSSLGSSQTMFTYEELVIATNGFSKGNILGEGGFGFVHKGVLPTGKEVAVKSLKSDSGQGEREFKAEVDIISRVHHRYLVSLVGYCNTGSLRLLVYELVPNKTLEFHLHGKGQPEMEWPARMKVAIGAAKGLAYLHEDCHPRIIHRDIKAANILLDNNFEAKVADFGLAKFYSVLDTHVSTRVMGSLGYLAPEYASSGQLTAKSDVYSFGVILLELITGRRPFDRTRDVIDLVEWGRPLLTNAIQDENFNYLVDPLIQYCFKHTEMARMIYCAAACVRKSARRRPRMSQIVRALEGNMPLSDLKEGVMSDIRSVNRGDISEYSGSEYQGDSTEFRSTGMSTKEPYFSGEDAMTSEYGLYPSSSSGEGGTTRELDIEEVRREIRRAQRPLFNSTSTQN